MDVRTLTVEQMKAAWTNYQQPNPEMEKNIGRYGFWKHTGVPIRILAVSGNEYVYGSLPHVFINDDEETIRITGITEILSETSEWWYNGGNYAKPNEVHLFDEMPLDIYAFIHSPNYRRPKPEDDDLIAHAMHDRGYWVSKSGKRIATKRKRSAK